MSKVTVSFSLVKRMFATKLMFSSENTRKKKKVHQASQKNQSASFLCFTLCVATTRSVCHTAGAENPASTHFNSYFVTKPTRCIVRSRIRRAKTLRSRVTCVFPSTSTFVVQSFQKKASLSPLEFWIVYHPDICSWCVNLKGLCRYIYIYIYKFNFYFRT